MPGSSTITTVVSVSNRRNIFPSTSRIYTYDAEIYIGDDKAGQRRHVKSVVHHLIAPDEKEPEEKSFCFISGKVGSIEPNTFFGKGYRAEEYDLEIDAVVFYQMLNCAASSPAVVTISGLIGQEVRSNEFYFNITQYIVKESKTAAHRVHIPESGRLSNIAIQTGAQVSIGGRISNVAEEVSLECAVKRLPIEVQELAFLTLAGGACPQSSAPVRGKSPAWKAWQTSLPGNSAASGNPSKPPTSTTAST